MFVELLRVELLVEFYPLECTKKAENSRKMFSFSENDISDMCLLLEIIQYTFE